jgi:Ser-tRNA(Ala) deacylase AlaX
MTLPTTDTLVTYATGDLESAATVLHVESLADGRRAVLLDTSCVHPVDAGWPDQGADRAMMRVGDAEYTILDCIVGATDGLALFLGRDIPVSKGTNGWAFVSVHVLAGDSVVSAGDRVELVVDADYRTRLSVGHTACHLASLALNRAVADRWKKEVRTDGLGSPDFDGTAIDVSTIRENGSIDTFRLGKSLRKKGFVTEGIADALPTLEAAINSTLAEWSTTDAPVHIERDGERLTDRRYWVCALVEQTVRIPCGGTHADSVSALGQVRVTLSLADVEGTPVLTMETFASPA